MEPFYKILHCQFAKKSRYLEKRNNHTGKEKNNFNKILQNEISRYQI